MINRLISESIAKTKKSILLLGPRQVGKSTLVSRLTPDLSINLADEVEFMTHSSHPEELAKLIELQSAKSIFIDEIQRLPRILNTVQALADKQKGLKFYLTGSSARKLKRGGANLLPGRVLNFKLGPLVAAEMAYKFDTKKILSRGSLPEAYLEGQSNEAEHLLKSYAANYLKEEIKAEALTRNIESFARFLNESVLSVAQFMDLTKIAKKAKISRHAIPRYFEILEDTLIGYRVFPFAPLAESEDLIRHPKFYLFDNGVYNGMLQNFIPSADRIGILAEQLVFIQILHSAWAWNKDITISSFRTRKGIEVDFIAETKNGTVAIEVKAGDRFTTEDGDGLLYFQKVFPRHSGLFIFHMGHTERRMGPIWALPWQKGLRELGL
ncbi:MAG: AAA family ATPase [Oligoflexia bacterium]|nr:AAA family ATPase [Oligoflexia bacterium]